jgi:beta-glucosidase
MIGGWLAQTPAVLEAWYLGGEGGNSVADVLFGDVNPSGRMPDTLAAHREDYPDFGNYPGSHGEVKYAEGIFVGYRHFDKESIAPLFPFGYGLSYTTFEYRDLNISPASMAANGKATVSLAVRNTGKRAGDEVVQLYIHDPKPLIEKPVRELKRFAKVSLRPGESKTVTFTLDAEALAYCDVPGKQWRADPGRYEVQIGASSRDIRLRGNLDLAALWTKAVPEMGKWKTETPQNGPNLALGRPATASSIEGDNTRAENAVDDSMDTRWSSKFADPQWISVDLGKVAKVSRVGLHWETAYASAYSIEVSTDNTTWREVYSTEAGQGEEEMVTFDPVDARYVRLTCRKRGTEFGYSLFDFAIYGPQGP